jgi:hypothetical protein
MEMDIIKQLRAIGKFNEIIIIEIYSFYFHSNLQKKIKLIKSYPY